MSTFKYRAKKGPEEIVELQIEAVSKEEAVEKINQMGYIPVKVEEVLISGQKTKIGIDFGHLKIKSQLITGFSRQLAILLKSGVPILNGLSILATQSDNYYLKAVLNAVREEVKDGRSLSSTLSAYPHLFSPLYIALVRAGENSGNLEKSLLRIAEYRYKQEQIMSTIRTALTYPVLMAGVGVMTVIFMLTFVMPRLLKIFTRLGQSLPLPTKILISISDFLRQGWFWIVLVVLGIIFLIKIGRRSPRERLILSVLKLRLPVMGDLVLKSEIARFSRTLELLLKSGIQLLKAIEISMPTLNNEFMRQHLKVAYDKIEQGETLSNTLRQTRLFPQFMINLISVGEESGRLEEVLQELAGVYERETDEAVKVMTTLLEPLMILLMGLIVGFIIISMLLPVFQINLLVK